MIAALCPSVRPLLPDENVGGALGETPTVGRGAGGRRLRVSLVERDREREGGREGERGRKGAREGGDKDQGAS